MKIEDVKNKKFLARGKRGVVYRGIYKGKGVAIKKKRKDSLALNRIQNEEKFLKLLNGYDIGPKFIGSGDDFLVYEFVKGKFILKWIEENDKDEIVKILKKIFSQLYRMDELGINKEEMHHPLKHIIIDKKPVMIDFERCSYTKKPKNITQFCEFIARISEVLKKKGINIEKDKIRGLARVYKNKRTEENYIKIIKEIS